MKRRKKKKPLVQLVLPSKKVEPIGGQSEVARLRQQFQAEWDASQLGLSGLALVARHQFITARMERMGELHERLKGLMGDLEGTKIIAEIMDTKLPEEGA